MTDTEDSRTTNQAPPYVSMQSLELKFNDDQEIHDRLVSDVSNVVSCDDKSDPDYKSPPDWSNEWCKKTLLPRLVFTDQLFLPIETCYRLIRLKQVIEQDEQGDEARRNYAPSSVLTEAELYLRIYPRWMLDKKTGTLTAKREKVKESDDETGGTKPLDFVGKGDCGDDMDSCGEDDTGNEGATRDAIDLDDKLTLDSDSEDITDEERRVNTIEDGGKILIDAIRDRFMRGETIKILAEDYRLSLQEISEMVEDIMQEEAPKKKSKKAKTDGKVRRCELYEIVKGRKYNSKKVGLCWYYE